MQGEAPSPLKILVVEDNATCRLVTVKLLESLGYQPHVATNGNEALALCDCFSYDVILMDCHMPDLSGLEVTRRLRKRQTQPQLIVAFTASYKPEEKDAVLAAGMSCYIQKPISKAALQVLLNHFQTRCRRGGE